MKSLLARLVTFLRALVENGGPSVVRFVFWATATTITLSWCALVAAIIGGYFHFGHADRELCVLTGAIAVTLTGFTSYTTNTKTVTDAQKAAGTPGTADVGVFTTHTETPESSNG